MKLTHLEHQFVLVHFLPFFSLSPPLNYMQQCRLLLSSILLILVLLPLPKAATQFKSISTKHLTNLGIFQFALIRVPEENYYHAEKLNLSLPVVNMAGRAEIWMEIYQMNSIIRCWSNHVDLHEEFDWNFFWSKFDWNSSLSWIENENRE